MRVTEVRVFPTSQKEDKLRAFINVTFDDCFVVHGLKVIEGSKGLFVVMPSRKIKEDDYRDIVHPITLEFRDYLEREVLNAYKARMEQGPASQGSNEEPFE